MPRAMMPRLRWLGLPSFCSATARTAAAISVTSEVWRTSAVEGAVRPQPVRVLASVVKAPWAPFEAPVLDVPLLWEDITGQVTPARRGIQGGAPWPGRGASPGVKIGRAHV